MAVRNGLGAKFCHSIRWSLCSGSRFWGELAQKNPLVLNKGGRCENERIEQRIQVERAGGMDKTGQPVFYRINAAELIAELVGPEFPSDGQPQ